MYRLFKVIFLVCIASLGLSSCVVNYGLSGNVCTRTYDVGDEFRSIDLAGAVRAVYADCHAVEVSADENVLPEVKVFVRDGTLYVKAENTGRREYQVDVRIPFRNGLENLSLSGSATFITDCPVHTSCFSLKESGASRFIGGIKAERVDLKLSGASVAEFSTLMVAHDATVTLVGASSVSGRAAVNLLKADFNGASRLVSKKENGSYIFKVQTLTGSVSGSSRVRMDVRKSIENLSVSGSSSVLYTGAPEPVDVDVDITSSCKEF